MQIGTIKWFDATKGYGFITPNDGSKDVFVHIKDVRKSKIDPEDLQKGDTVEFRVEAGAKGPVAVGINILPGC